MNTVAWILLVITCFTSATLILVIARRPRPEGDRDVVPPGERTDLAEMARDRRRSTEIIERMAEGVLVLNEALTPVMANGSSRRLLGLPDGSLPMALSGDEIVDVARRALDEQAAIEEVVQVWFPARMSLRVHAAPLEDRGVVVVLQDVTQELLTQRIRREFAASASHELKSPVASLQALAEALQDAARRDPDVAVRFADQIVTEAQRLAKLISSLLDLSRLEEAVERPRALADVTLVVHEVVESLRDAIDESGVKVTTRLTPGAAVLGDDQQLALMVRNLLDNAIRYTPANGIVSVEVERDGADVVLVVSDTGIGIPEASHERIFERFYRVDAGRSRSMGGSGLGLAIVKHVVELHRGHISLVSRVGAGTSFTVRIPAAEASAPRVEAPVGSAS